MNLLKSTGTYGFYTIISRLLGNLREILIGVVFGILLVLPFSPITIPYLFKRAEKLGIDIIPSWYKKLDLNDDENKLK